MRWCSTRLYFDTDDLRLARSGATLRRRTGGEDAGWHLKLPTGRPGTRTELHAPLGEDVDVPAELADLVRARTRAKPLVPVLRLETVRTVTRLLAEDGSLLLEIADDRVLAEPNGAPSRTWREIEVERHSAGKGLVGRVDALLREAGASPAAWPSKVTHALGDVVPAAPLVPPACHDDLVTERLRAQRTEFVARDADVRRELPEAVHDMRVACRRLRSCLRTFGPLFEREPARHLLDELAWIAGVLGAERDLEVLEARIERSLAGLDDVEVTRAVRRILSERFDAGRAAADAEILTALGGERYCQLLDELDVFASDPPFGVPLRARRVTRLRRLAAMELRRTRRWVERAEAAVGEERDHAFHQARKAAKRVRYAAEVLAPAYRGEARVVVERFTRPAGPARRAPRRRRRGGPCCRRRARAPGPAVGGPATRSGRWSATRRPPSPTMTAPSPARGGGRLAARCSACSVEVEPGVRPSKRAAVGAAAARERRVRTGGERNTRDLRLWRAPARCGAMVVDLQVLRSE